MGKVWTVGELTSEIGRVFAGQRQLQNCWVSGEISNFKNHRPSGHWYFTLKDEVSSLKAVMFKVRASRVPFNPQDGMKVIIRGSIKIYERDGNIQLYADEMQPDGLGTLYLAFEQLKQRLAAQGLFREERKRPLPRYPKKVGIVTSPTGAALRDIVTIMNRRNPGVSWVLAPASVQGEGAPTEIAKAIRRLNQYGEIDLLIVGRGGGSIEELSAFNTEEVALAIAASRIPVISAVGHETDFTIADLAADLRAPTPSAAAELAVPILMELKHGLLDLEKRLENAIMQHLQDKRRRLELLATSSAFTDPFMRYEQERQRLDLLASRMEVALTRFIEDRNGILKLLAAKLDLLSPLAILGRGYSLVYGDNDTLVRSIHEVGDHEKILVRLAEGKLRCEILEKES